MARKLKRTTLRFFPNSENQPTSSVLHNPPVGVGVGGGEGSVSVSVAESKWENWAVENRVLRRVCAETGVC